MNKQVTWRHFVIGILTILISQAIIGIFVFAGNLASKPYVNKAIEVEKNERIESDNKLKDDNKDLKDKVDFIYKQAYKDAYGRYPEY